MNKTAIKICGIQNAKTASNCVQLGANYIGLVFYHGSKRNITTTDALPIAIATKKEGGEPVAVFVDKEHDEIIAICKKTGIRYVQLHGQISKNESKYLPNYFIKIYVINVEQDGKIVDNGDEHLSCLDPTRDFLLFDGMQAGSGNTFNIKNFYDVFKNNKLNRFNFFIAGGLNVHNVSQIIAITKPFAVDISGGVENRFGKKDLKQISNFIEKVRTTGGKQ